MLALLITLLTLNGGIQHCDSGDIVVFEDGSISDDHWLEDSDVVYYCVRAEGYTEHGTFDRVSWYTVTAVGNEYLVEYGWYTIGMPFPAQQEYFYIDRIPS